MSLSRTFLKITIALVMVLSPIITFGQNVNAATTNANVSTGWVSDGDYWYYYNKGKKQVGWVLDQNKWYYLDGKGRMLADTWLDYNGGWYLLLPSGEMAVDYWFLWKGEWYFMKADGLMATSWVDTGNYRYYLRADGRLVYADWLSYKGKWYYLTDSGRMASGWVSVQGSKYYLNPKGDMATGWLLDGGYWYYLHSSGKMATTEWVDYNGGKYYLQKDGKMAVGWLAIKNNWYYFNPGGAMATGWFSENDVWYYLTENGTMATGWKTIGGVRYYFMNSGVWDPGRFEGVNTTKSMKFTSTGISYAGNAQFTPVGMRLVNLSTGAEYGNDSTHAADFTCQVDLSYLPSGTYALRVYDGRYSHDPVNKLELINQIVRAKIGNKLVTISYPNNTVQVTISDFAYKYDVFINVGHGGVDSGATNAFTTERTLNLIVSQYEKARYEQHGLRVLLSRETTDSYGLMMGDKKWKNLTQSAYAVGYYGSVSKIVYSNHHNSSSSSSSMGWEILVPASLTKSELAPEVRVASILRSIYPLTENHTRFYTRHYDTNVNYSKENGQVYGFRNYYAINRVPLELFNVKAPIYEGCYLSSLSDYNWYYTNGNWKKVSEAKIKAYVESIGVPYQPNGVLKKSKSSTVEEPITEPNVDSNEKLDSYLQMKE